MSDVVVDDVWARCVSDFKALATKWGAAFTLKKMPNGKEVVVVEQWFNQKGVNTK